MELEDPAGLVAQLVDHEDIISVGVIGDGLVTVFLIKLVCLVDHLHAALDGAFACSCIFHDGQRFPILAIHDVINIVSGIQMDHAPNSAGQGLMRHGNDGPSCLPERSLQI